jgi:predicted nucleotidyltransferase
MGLDPTISEKRAAILRIASLHGAVNVRVFGSAARGAMGPGSDVDFLVDVGAPHSSWFPAGLVLDLEDLLGRKVDVLTENAVYPPLRERILAEAIPL